MSAQPKSNDDAEAGAQLASTASALVRHASENCTLSALQLASVFRIAAATCDELHQINERAEVAVRMRGMFPKR